MELNAYQTRKSISIEGKPNEMSHLLDDCMLKQGGETNFPIDLISTIHEVFKNLNFCELKEKLDEQHGLVAYVGRVMIM